MAYKRFTGRVITSMGSMYDTHNQTSCITSKTKTRNIRYTSNTFYQLLDDLNNSKSIYLIDIVLRYAIHTGNTATTTDVQATGPSTVSLMLRREKNNYDELRRKNPTYAPVTSYTPEGVTSVNNRYYNNQDLRRLGLGHYHYIDELHNIQLNFGASIPLMSNLIFFVDIPIIYRAIMCMPAFYSHPEVSEKVYQIYVDIINLYKKRQVVFESLYNASDSVYDISMIRDKVTELLPYAKTIFKHLNVNNDLMHIYTIWCTNNKKPVDI